MSERFHKTRDSMRTYLEAREKEGFRRITVFVHDEDRALLKKYSDRKLKARGWFNRKGHAVSDIGMPTAPQGAR